LKDDDLERLFKKRVKLPKLLIIDEATHFNAVELQLLDKVAKLHGIKILTLGDDL
jgi:DNA transposition AAA+ family ATPase